MCPNYTIGLNETKLGIVAPFWFMSAMRNVLPRRVAEKSLTMGTMFSTEEALQIGLIDEVATDKADAIQKCVGFLNNFKKVSPEARGLTKQSFRNKDIQELEDNRAQDVELFAFAVNQKKVQQGLEVYMQSLKQKK
jgi:Delta3-Delta2-enoyl-CoA isomerase